MKTSANQYYSNFFTINKVVVFIFDKYRKPDFQNIVLA